MKNKVKYTDDQQEVINSRNCNILVAAAAGSGKTAVLVERIIKMVTDKDNPIDIDRLLVVTFTNAAAAQMREKITKALEEAQEEAPYDEHLVKQLSLIHRSHITTIHSFCLDVIRNNFNLLDLDPNFRIGDEGEIKLIKQDVMAKVLENNYNNLSEEFVAFIESYAPGKGDGQIEEIIEKLYNIAYSYPTPEVWIKNARESFEVDNIEQLNNYKWMYNILDYTSKIIEGCLLKAKMILEISESAGGPFQYKEAIDSDKEMFEKLLSCKSFDDYYTGFKSFYFADLSRKRPKDIDPAKKNFVKETRDSYKKEIDDIRKKFFAKSSKDVIEDIIQVKPSMNVLLDLVEEYGTLFSNGKREKNIIDFGDIEHMALNLLICGYNQDNTPIYSKTANELKEFYYEILVDEYQDSNFLQEALLTSVSKISDGINNMFMVGDVKQSIYKFRMARPDIFMNKYNTYKPKDEDNRKIELKCNFRSREVVLESINYMFYQIMCKELGDIDYVREVALVTGRKFEAFNEAAKKENNLKEELSSKGDISTTTELIIIEELNEETDKEEIKEENKKKKTKDYKEDNKEITELNQMELEAKVIAHRIKELVEGDSEKGIEPLFVWDDKLKEYRKSRYKDIVILLRTINVWADVFSKVLLSENISNHTDSRNGYFSTIEIENILSLLSVIDNSYLDIQLAAVLRSPMCGITSEELAQIKIEGDSYSKKKSLYEDIIQYTETGDNEELIDKLLNILNMLNKLKDAKVYMSISELIWYALDMTGYFTYVKAMPAGDVREANILMLIEKACSYEETCYKGVFNFIKYIEQLRQYEVDFGEANLLGEDDDTVRIMSIHKSKGLEFPIVFVSGMNKRFNHMDARSSIVMSSDYFLGPSKVDYLTRTKTDTLIHRALQNSLTIEDLGEELRVFYVALTRAQEKLIMTGYVSDFEKLLNKLRVVSYSDSVKINYGILSKTNSYLEWTLLSLFRNLDFINYVNEYMNNEIGEDFLEIDKENVIEAENTKFNINIKKVNKMVVEEIEAQVYKQKQQEDISNLKTESINKELFQSIQDNLLYEYKYNIDSSIKSKYSVSEIKKLGHVQTEGEEEEVVIPQLYSDSTKPIPKFIDNEEKIEPTSRGTAYHKFLELLDFSKVKSDNIVEERLNELINKGIIEKKYREIISINEIRTLLDSELGRRMIQATKNNKIYKEKQFVTGKKANEIINTSKVDELVLVQGIIDLYFIENNEIVVVDYKTDKVNLSNKNKLIERYKVQLDTYGEILEKLTNMKVKEKYIYSLELGMAIEV